MLMLFLLTTNDTLFPRRHRMHVGMLIGSIAGICTPQTHQTLHEDEAKAKDKDKEKADGPCPSRKDSEETNKRIA